MGSQWLDWPNTFPFFICQARGGLLLLVAYSLWSARSALIGALSQKTQLSAGFLLGLALLWLWALAVGISLVAVISRIDRLFSVQSGLCPTQS